MKLKFSGLAMQCFSVELSVRLCVLLVMEVNEF